MTTLVFRGTATMPNWCDNELTISGPITRVKECSAAIGSKANRVDFQRIVQMPLFVEDEREWCREHWGTKWNAHGAIGIVDELGNEAEAEFEFATAWSPPLPIIKTLGERYPDLTFTLVYYESGMAFHGRYRVEGGRVEEDVCGVYYGDRGG